VCKNEREVQLMHFLKLILVLPLLYKLVSSLGMKNLAYLSNNVCKKTVIFILVNFNELFYINPCAFSLYVSQTCENSNKNIFKRAERAALLHLSKLLGRGCELEILIFSLSIQGVHCVPGVLRNYRLHNAELHTLQAPHCAVFLSFTVITSTIVV